MNAHFPHDCTFAPQAFIDTKKYLDSYATQALNSCFFRVTFLRRGMGLTYFFTELFHMHVRVLFWIDILYKKNILELGLGEIS